MTKNELIKTLVEKTEMTKKDTELFLNTLINTITETLAEGEKVQITGFGTFDITNRKGRIGRNPATGEDIKIAPSKTPKFKAGKALKDTVNGR